jgi:serpin B
MAMNKAFFGVVAALVLLAAACTGGGAAQPEIVRSVAVRDASPDVSEELRSELAGGNTAFAFDLYQALREDDGNLFFSPFSISAALAMVYGGARNETERQMAETLHFDLPQEGLHPAFNALDQDLNADTGQKEEDFQLRVANSLWGQSGFEFKSEFLDLIATNYGAGLNLVDFVDSSNREGARLAINEWASEQTEGKIKDLVPDGVLDDLTRLVLANAIYFNAKWEDPFRGAEDDEFTLLDGRRIPVQMMHSSRSRYFSRYVREEGYQAVELDYKGDEAQMIVVLPDEGRFEEIEALLDRELMENILRTFARTNLRLFMPRFEYEASLSLVETLEKMGMRDAFSTEVADFSGISPRFLFIKDVLHKAFVAVDEEGTEAAAATAAIAEAVSAPIQEPTVVRIDRPFIFVIRDSEHDTVLFVGRVLDPTK